MEKSTMELNQLTTKHAKYHDSVVQHQLETQFEHKDKNTGLF